jgi:chemotaxis receptor (MCP) glutamine deamidase CheD
MGARKDTVERRINGGQSTLSVPDMVDLGTYSNNQNVALGFKED